MRKLFVLFVLVFLVGCAPTMIVENGNRCRLDNIEWEATELVHAACVTAGAKPKPGYVINGCYFPKADGSYKIITGPIVTERDLQTLGHEVLHHCKGNFHD